MPPVSRSSCASAPMAATTKCWPLPLPTRPAITASPARPARLTMLSTMSSSPGAKALWPTGTRSHHLPFGQQFHRAVGRDVRCAAAASGSVISLPTALQWKARRSGETYRRLCICKGKQLQGRARQRQPGHGHRFMLPQGSLPDGSYQAVVQVRDAIVGYGQSQGAVPIHGRQGSERRAEPEPELRPGQGPDNRFGGRRPTGLPSCR